MAGPNIYLNLKRNGESLFYDPAFKDGDRPLSGGGDVFSDADYPPIPTVEPAANDQRFVGGVGASDSNDGTTGTPWATLDKAMQELCASSTWYCLNLSGDLTVSTRIWTKTYGSGPGTISQFVYIRKDPAVGGDVTLTLNDTLDIDGQSFWLWWGFKRNGTDGIRLGYDTSTPNQTFRDSPHIMDGTLGGDNLGGIRALNKNPIRLGVFNCPSIGPGIIAPVHQNTSAIVVFGIVELRIENCEIENYPRDIYYKHSNNAVNGAADVHIRRNWCKSETGLGAYFTGRAESGTWEVVDNIFETNISISNGGGGEQPDGVSFKHNTVRGDVFLEEAAHDVINSLVFDNIIEGDYRILPFGTEINTNISNNNLFGADIIYHSTTYDLPTWQSNSVPVSQDVNSIAGLPTYTGGANPTTVTGFTLNGGNGVNAGSDGADMGADTSVVGVQ